MLDGQGVPVRTFRKAGCVFLEREFGRIFVVLLLITAAFGCIICSDKIFAFLY